MKALPRLLQLLPIVLLACGPSPDEQYEDARELVQSGQYPAAVSLLNEVLAEQPERAEAYNLRGVAYFEQNNVTEAVSEFGQAIRLDELDYRPYYNRANAYRALSDLPAALQDYNEVISREPKLPDAYLNRAIVLTEMNNLPAAYRDMQEALSLAPTDTLVLLNAGKLFLQVDSLAAAEQTLTSLVNKNNKQAEAYYLLGQVKRQQNLPEEACTLFKQAEKNGYVRAQAYINISCTTQN